MVSFDGFDSLFNLLERWRPGDGNKVGRFGQSQLNRNDVNNYQRNRMRKYFERDNTKNANSLDRDFLRQRDDLNALRANNLPGGSNIHQGKNADSLNIGEIGGNGNHNLIQHGGLNFGDITGGKSGFLWQGANDDSVNVARGNAENNTIWQRGDTNFATSDGKNNTIWQGGYKKSDNLYQGTDNENGRDNVTQVSGSGGRNDFIGGAGRNTGLQQVNDGTSNYDGRQSNGTSDITQRGNGGEKIFNGGDNVDKLKIEGNNNKLNVNTGAGDDEVTVSGRGMTGTLDGGDGNDTLKLDGSLNDYNLAYKAGENGNQGTFTFTRDGKSFDVKNFENFKFNGGRSYSEQDLIRHTQRNQPQQRTA